MEKSKDEIFSQNYINCLIDISNGLSISGAAIKNNISKSNIYKKFKSISSNFSIVEKANILLALTL